ncbi:phage-related hypothetical protein [plant metagenome]|uniref:Uncharacterized protein n=1 Tax=plant metagenome TaxID=1297885 RepID=A0A484VCB8_9ZZZZ
MTTPTPESRQQTETGCAPYARGGNLSIPETPHSYDLWHLDLARFAMTNLGHVVHPSREPGSHHKQDRLAGALAGWIERNPTPSLQAQASAPAGYVLVPVEHTLDMVIAFAEVWYSKRRAIDDHDMQDAYAAMLAAAPTPPKCLTCGDNGALGNILDTVPCPDCTPPAALDQQAVRDAVIANLLELARIVDRAVDDWGESHADGSSHVIFQKGEAEKRDAILDFFDSLPENPDPLVLDSGPLKAARALKSTSGGDAK